MVDEEGESGKGMLRSIEVMKSVIRRIVGLSNLNFGRSLGPSSSVYCFSRSEDVSYEELICKSCPKSCLEYQVHALVIPLPLPLHLRGPDRDLVR